MKLYKNAIILIVIVGLLVGAYFILNAIKKPEENNGSTYETIRLLDYTSDKIDTLTLTNNDGTFVIQKKDTEWVVVSPADFKADSSKLSSLAINAASVIADKVVEEDAKDLTIYGLDKPVTVHLKITDGTEKTLMIGDATPTKGGYYAKLGDSNKVYVIGTYTANALLVTRLQMKNKTLYELNSDDIISISMKRKGSDVFSAQKNAEIDWQILTPIKGNANLSALSPMLEALTTTTASEYVEENAQDLSKYGLVNPAYEFEFATSSQSYKLLLGAEKDKGSTRYAKLGSSNDVFVISESNYTFLDKPFKEIIEVFAYIVNIDQVNKIELTMNGKTDVFTIDTYKDEEGNTDTDKDKFTMNGKDATMKDENDKQVFRNFYQALIGVTLDEILVKDVPMGTPEITIVYYLKSAPGKMTVEYVNYEENYYSVFKNGEFSGILVKKNKKDFGIEGLKEAYQKLEEAVNAQQ